MDVFPQGRHPALWRPHGDDIGTPFGALDITWHSRTVEDEYGSVDWIVQVLTNLLRCKVATAFDLARLNVVGAETGHNPSRMYQVEASIATLFVHCSHVPTRAFGIKLLDHKLVLLRLRLNHMTIAPRYP